MAKYIIVEDGVVVNIIEAEAEIAATLGAILHPENTYINMGFLYNGVTFTDPNPPPIEPEEPWVKPNI